MRRWVWHTSVSWCFCESNYNFPFRSSRTKPFWLWTELMSQSDKEHTSLKHLSIICKQKLVWGTLGCFVLWDYLWSWLNRVFLLVIHIIPGNVTPYYSTIILYSHSFKWPWIIAIMCKICKSYIIFSDYSLKEFESNFTQKQTMSMNTDISKNIIIIIISSINNLL